MDSNLKPNDKKAVNTCKKHSQGPGVCSICLTKRLSQLQNIAATSSGSSKVGGLPSSLSSSCSDLSSSDVSLCSSPVVNYTYLEAGKPMKVFKNVGQNVLKKSRSMVNYALQRRQEEGKNIDVKRGFWSKLLHRKGKALRYSTTMRERVVSEAVH